MSAASESVPFSWRSIALPAFAPALLFSLGEGAILPIIPLAAEHLGASLPIAGVVASLIVVGTLIGDLPSGVLVSRIGERRAMIGAAAVSALGLALCVLAPNAVVLGAGVLLVGIATAVFALARQAFLTTVVPTAIRARALSSLGGTFRAGYFFGPFIAAAVIAWTGMTASAFWIHLVACLLVVVLLLVVPDPTETITRTRHAAAVTASLALAAAEHEGDDRRGLDEAESRGLFATLRRNARVLLHVGSGAAVLQALRSSRQVILPLAALAIGIGDAQTALIIGIAGGVDFALFYTSGAIMDRFGRMWSVLPSMIGLSLMHVALAAVLLLADPEPWFIVVAIAMSVVNGVGSGIVMTLGSDLAGRRDPAPFLGAWRFTSDAGQAVAPLIVSGVAALASLPVASVVIAVLGAIGATGLGRTLPRYIPSPPRRPRTGRALSAGRAP